MVTPDPAQADGLELEVQFAGQPHAPQQPQRVIEQVRFADGPQPPRRQVRHAAAGIKQSTGWLDSLQRQGDRIGAVVPAEQVVVQVGP
jgi:hypothetical protein